MTVNDGDGCTVLRNDKAGGVDITCGGTTATVMDGNGGTGGCSLEPISDGDMTIGSVLACDDSEPVIIPDVFGPYGACSLRQQVVGDELIGNVLVCGGSNPVYIPVFDTNGGPSGPSEPSAPAPLQCVPNYGNIYFQDITYNPTERPPTIQVLSPECPADPENGLWFKPISCNPMLRDPGGTDHFRFGLLGHWINNNSCEYKYTCANPDLTNADGTVTCTSKGHGIAYFEMCCLYTFVELGGTD